MSAASGRATGGQLEERLDLTHETSQKIAQATALLQSPTPTALASALSLLSAHEKKCRMGNDTPSLLLLCRAMLTLARDADATPSKEVLRDTLHQLATRRSQKSKAISCLVETVLPWIVEKDGYTPLAACPFAVEARNALIQAVRTIAEGKMYLEAEFARMSRSRAILWEEEGNVAEAASVLGEVHVETYGSLSKREKVEFVLEQMRLNLMRKDYVRAHIVSNKIKKSTLEEEGMSSLKVKYYSLLASYFQQHDRNALELAKCFHAIYGTFTGLVDDKSGATTTNVGSGSGGEDMNEEALGWKEALTNTVVFLCLSEYSNEVKDMMERIRLDPRLEKIVECRDTIKAFLKNEIMHYPLPHQTTLESIPAFSTATLSPDLLAPGNNPPDETLRSHWHTTFHTRIIQHNLRVVSMYYRRIHLSRLSQLLSLPSAEAESHISQMVSSGSLYAKIDRPKDIVRFSKKRSEEEVLSDWAADIKQLLGLVEETSYLIQKENMVQSH